MPLSDGLYSAESRAEGYRFEIRVDLAGLNKISGEVYFLDAAGWVYRNSFFCTRVDPFPFTTAVSLRVQFLGSNQEFALDVSRPDAAAPIQAIFHDAGGKTVALAVAREADSLRRFDYEVDVQDGFAYPPDPVPFNGRTLTVEGCYADAGLELTRRGQTDTLVGVDRDHPWTQAELLGLFQHFQLANQMRDFVPAFYLVVLGRYATDNVTGIMYDVGRRAGAAVFAGAIAGLFPDPAEFRRNYLRTVVHEMGHAMNLPHAFEVGRLADGRPLADRGVAEPTFMNYPHEFTGSPDGAGPGADDGQRRRNFWATFQYQFAQRELEHLRHGPRRNVWMGSGVEPYQGSTIGDLAGGLDRPPPAPRPPWVPRSDDGVRLDLRVRPSRPGNLFEFGEPVHVELKLRNAATAARAVARIVDPATGRTEFHIQGPDRQTRPFRPHHALCAERDAKPLKAKEADHHDICLSYGADGFTFLEPGRYVIRAAYRTADETIHSNPLALWVRYPTPETERLIVPTLDDEVALFFAVGGQPELATAVRRLDDLMAQQAGRERRGRVWLRPDAHPLARHYAKVRAHLSARGHLAFRKRGRRVHSRWAVKPEPDYHWFRQALKLGDDFEPDPSEPAPFSNIVFGDVLGTLVRALQRDSGKVAKTAADRLLKLAVSHLKGQKAKPKTIRAYRRWVTDPA